MINLISRQRWYNFFLLPQFEKAKKDYFEFKIAVILLLSFSLVSCSHSRSNNKKPYSKNYKFSDRKADEIGDNYSGRFKIGNPYKIRGITYYPQDFENYVEYGRASWYGDDFHGKKTANGETYNMGDMTAAHLILPLPSIVRVTNLDNGKSVIVRVNDRGPFAKSRIIDVSQNAAIKLGFRTKGTANVKVEFLEKETEELLKKIKSQ
jgi:rare lipoprotein A (peptidoglycan hydrolase)